jgi:hypothetical protein
MRDPEPVRKKAKSDVTCECGHTWEAEGYEEGNWFDTAELCPECGEEYA